MNIAMTPTLTIPSSRPNTLWGAVTSQILRWLHLFFTTANVAVTGDSVSDEALMTAYLNGDQTAFRALFDRFAPKLHRAACRRGLCVADANDAVQQTFVHIHQSRRDFREGARVRPWIYTIAFNVMRDAGRRIQSLRRLRDNYKMASGAASRTSEPEPAADTSPRLQPALARLSAGQREVIELHYFEEISFGEIARMLGEGAVRVRAHRGYEKLRRLLSGPKTSRGIA
jgi:RNA polymerase sigma factor (sigma-70 family)